MEEEWATLEESGSIGKRKENCIECPWSLRCEYFLLGPTLTRQCGKKQLDQSDSKSLVSGKKKIETRSAKVTVFAFLV